MNKINLKKHSISFLLSLSLLPIMATQAFAGIDEATQFYDNKEYTKALTELNAPEVANTPKAQKLLGTMYLLGRGVEKNVPRSVELFQAAADKNQPDAQLNLGTMYMVGQNVPRDNIQALKWFTVRAAQNDSDAGLMLSFLLPSMNKNQKEKGLELASEYLKSQNIKFDEMALAKTAGVKKVYQ